MTVRFVANKNSKNNNKPSESQNNKKKKQKENESRLLKDDSNSSSSNSNSSSSSNNNNDNINITSNNGGKGKRRRIISIVDTATSLSSKSSSKSTGTEAETTSALSTRNNFLSRRSSFAILLFVLLVLNNSFSTFQMMNLTTATFTTTTKDDPSLCAHHHAGMTNKNDDSVTTMFLNDSDSNSNSQARPQQYPLDSDTLEKYVIDTSKESHPRRGWDPIYDKHYDCSQDFKTQKYTPSLHRLESSFYKSQSQEDLLMYQHFFHNNNAATTTTTTTTIDRKHYFLEIGAFDGITLSNTYFYEFELGWNGILIEAETTSYQQLEINRGQKKSNRDGNNGNGGNGNGDVGDVTTVHVAICNQPQLKTMIGTGPTASTILGRAARNGGYHITTVPCIPMRDVLKMVEIPFIDFFSLDVEGAELEVIESTDFTAVPVHTILVEMRLVDENTNGKSNAKIRRALYARGFCRYSNIFGHFNEVWVNTTWTEPPPPPP